MFLWYADMVENGPREKGVGPSNQGKCLAEKDPPELDTLPVTILEITYLQSLHSAR